MLLSSVLRVIHFVGMSSQPRLEVGLCVTWGQSRDVGPTRLCDLLALSVSPLPPFVGLAYSWPTKLNGWAFFLDGHRQMLGPPAYTHTSFTRHCFSLFACLASGRSDMYTHIQCSAPRLARRLRVSCCTLLSEFRLGRELGLQLRT